MSNYELLNAEVKDMQGFVLAALTDAYIVDKWPTEKLNPEAIEKALEIRVFNKEKEVKLFRGDIGKEFRIRTLDDADPKNENSAVEWFDQTQYLDIDTARSSGGSGEVRTTGGGTFFLPVGKMDDAKIIIRHYFVKDEESGCAKLVDWRVVGFEEV